MDARKVNEDPDKKQARDGSKEESAEAYRRRVYGDEYADQDSETRRPSVVRRLSRQLSRQVLRRRSSVIESLPETPAGWTVLASVVASAVLGYEIQLQKSLTCPPLVYGQYKDGPLKAIYETMTESPESVLKRPIQPSLFVGTRGLISSTAAYLLGGPSSRDHVQFREIIKMPVDGAIIAVDWELPVVDTTKSREERRDQVLHGSIDRPVVLIIHGLNNDANFGYIRSTMRACSNKGWIAGGMNLRGCGGVPLTTPRAYNGAYTGDIRCLVHTISGRLADGVPLFIVGNSLSASLVTKYLGEEGLCGTLPDCVAGGAALGNPSLMKATNLDIKFSPLLALGTKKTVLQHWSTIRQTKDPFYQSCIRRALMAVTLADFDSAIAPVMARNGPIYPFGFRIGYKDGPSYWNDASSYRLVRHISVPLLQLIAADDFLVYRPFRGKLAYSLANPNVMVIETKCGGHLGWQESPPEGRGYGVGTSWADVATADFIDAVFKTYHLRSRKDKLDADFYFTKEESKRVAATLRPRL